MLVKDYLPSEYIKTTFIDVFRKVKIKTKSYTKNLKQ